MADTRPPASKWLVTTDWLAARLGKSEIAIVDGSVYLPALKRDAKAEYLAGHIPGAAFFDIDAIADHSSDLPHMLPGATVFSEEVGKLGIGNKDTIVVDDGAGLGGAPRVWWTFRIFGAKNVFVLDGGLPKWKQEGRPVETGAGKRAARKFEANATPVVAGVSDVHLARIQTDPGDRGRQTAFAVRRRSHGRACGQAICRGRSMCRSPSLFKKAG
jgi:thiosulfate/3-mercaptopyruvate sulfurtransferase